MPVNCGVDVAAPVRGLCDCVGPDFHTYKHACCIYTCGNDHTAGYTANYSGPGNNGSRYHRTDRTNNGAYRTNNGSYRTDYGASGTHDRADRTDYGASGAYDRANGTIHRADTASAAGAACLRI